MKLVVFNGFFVTIFGGLRHEAGFCDVGEYFSGPFKNESLYQFRCHTEENNLILIMINS